MKDIEREFFAKAANADKAEKAIAPPDPAKGESRKRLLKVLGIVFVAIPAALLLGVLGFFYVAARMGIDPWVLVGAIFCLFVFVLYLFQGKGKGSWRDDPATQKQLDYLEDLGGDTSGNLTKGEASDRITELTGQ